MLLYKNTLEGARVGSLRLGAPIGTIEQTIYDPKQMQLVGWVVKEFGEKELRLLLTKNCRDIGPQAVLVDDTEALTPMSDVIRHKDLIELKFELIGIKVVNESGVSFGKVIDFAFHPESFLVQRILVEPTGIKVFAASKIIDRTQICEVTMKKITVKDARAKVVVADESVYGNALEKLRYRAKQTQAAADTAQNAAQIE
jgi:uncharacterized protein YrrD